MIWFIAYLALLGLAAALAVAAAVLAITRVAGRHARAQLTTAGVLLVLGTVPPSVVAVLWYARTADYRWAIQGPGVFAQLGGGPAMLAAFTLTAVWTAGCWIAAIRLASLHARDARQ